ncbi:hypothetical protein, partial [Vibrio lentus]|uniref:hypothetical protein n=1 Tax=Vibrio lentus TaxID=136468 RepID=UPI001A7E1990
LLLYGVPVIINFKKKEEFFSQSIPMILCRVCSSPFTSNFTPKHDLQACKVVGGLTSTEPTKKFSCSTDNSSQFRNLARI